MSVAYASSSLTGPAADAATSVIATAPTGVAVGDVLIGVSVCVDARTFTAPTGWTVVGNDTNGTYRVQVWSRTATSADAAAASFTFTGSTYSSANVALIRLTGADATAVTAAFATGTNAQTQATPAITTSAAGSLVVWGVCITAAAGPPTGSTRGTLAASGGSFLATYTEQIATAGVQSAATISTTGYGSKRTFAIAVGPSSTTAAVAPTSNAYLSLPGTTGSFASTPDKAALRITGDIDLRVRVGMTTWTPAVIQSVLAKEGSASTRSYRFEVTPTGALLLMLSADGTTNSTNVTSSVVTGFSAGSVAWIRATWRQSDGRVQFFTGIDGSSWTQLGSNLSIVVSGIASTTAPLEVGSRFIGTAEPVAGRVYAAEVRNGIDGTIVAFADFGAQSVKTTTWNDLAGNAWTLNGSAVIADKGPLDVSTPVGVYEPYRVTNLLANSDVFDGTGWRVGYTTCIATGGVYKLAETSAVNATAQHYLQQQLINWPSNTNITISVDVMAAERTRVGFQISTKIPTYPTTLFDLTAGAVVTGSGAGMSPTITALGSGWYRISITYSTSSGTNIPCWVLLLEAGSGNGATVFNYQGVAGSGVYVRHAQCSISSTAAYAVTDSLQSLTDQNGVSRNLLQSSEQFDSTLWTKSSATVTANQIIAPDGNTTADQVAITSNAVNQGLVSSISITTALGTYTFSVYVKQGTASGVTLQPNGTVDSVSTGVAQYFSFATNTFTGNKVYGNASAGSTSVTSIGNGWYRLTMTFTLTGTNPATNFHCWIYPYVQPYPTATTDAVGAYTYLWGAQLEAGSTASSYVPTGGVLPGLSGTLGATTTVGEATDPAYIGTGLYFSGSQYLTLDDKQLWGNGNSTIFGAVSILGTAGFKAIYAEGNTGSSVPWFVLWVDNVNTQHLRFDCESDTGAALFSFRSSMTLFDGNPHTFAVTVNTVSQSCAIYVDGFLDATQGFGTPQTTTLNTSTIGGRRHTSAAELITGTIHAIARHQYAMTATEVAAVHNYYRDQLASVGVSLPAGPAPLLHRRRRSA